MLFSRSLNKGSLSGWRMLLLDVRYGDALGTPKTKQAVPMLLAFLNRRMVEPIAEDTTVAEHREVKFSPCWMVFIWLVGAM